MQNKWYRQGSFTTSPHLFKFLASLFLAAIFTVFGFFGLNLLAIALIVVLSIPCWLFLEHAWMLEDIEIDINKKLNKHSLVQGLRQGVSFNTSHDGNLLAVQIGETLYKRSEYRIDHDYYGAGVYFTIVYLNDGKQIAIITENNFTLVYQAVEETSQ